MLAKYNYLAVILGSFALALVAASPVLQARGGDQMLVHVGPGARIHHVKEVFPFGHKEKLENFEGPGDFPLPPLIMIDGGDRGQVEFLMSVDGGQQFPCYFKRTEWKDMVSRPQVATGEFNLWKDVKWWERVKVEDWTPIKAIKGEPGVQMLCTRMPKGEELPEE